MLKTIPIIDIRKIGTVGLVEQELDRALDIINAGHKMYGRLASTVIPIGYTIGDILTYRWLRKSQNPYLSEIKEIAKKLGTPGGFALNCSYEWSCTTGISGKKNNIPTMVRILDWPQPGLGSNVVVAHSSGDAGEYYNVTWPGLVGVYTGLAAGRFAAAINQAPMKCGSFGLIGDWLSDRIKVAKNNALTPSQLLRFVFDHCKNYDEALEILTQTPICIPVIYILCGIKEGEGVIIERTEDKAIITPYPAAAANHWNSKEMADEYPKTRYRGIDSKARQASFSNISFDFNDFSWMNYPLLNKDTRLAVFLDPANSDLMVQGFERVNSFTSREATLVFRL